MHFTPENSFFGLVPNAVKHELAVLDLLLWSRCDTKPSQHQEMVTLKELSQSIRLYRVQVWDCWRPRLLEYTATWSRVTIAGLSNARTDRYINLDGWICLYDGIRASRLSSVRIAIDYRAGHRNRVCMSRCAMFTSSLL